MIELFAEKNNGHVDLMM